jgi:hypothetical protein
MNHRELAIQESEEWVSLSMEDRRLYTMPDYWKMLDDRSPSEVEDRRAVYLTRSEELWEAVGDGLRIQVAAMLAKQARRQNRPVAKVLAEYQEDPVAFNRKVRSRKRESWVSAVPLPASELAVDHRKLAFEESEGWERLSLEMRQQYRDMAKYWKATEGRSTYQVEARRSVYLVNDPLLWNAVQAGMPISDAATLARQASREHMAMVDVLAEYTRLRRKGKKPQRVKRGQKSVDRPPESQPERVVEPSSSASEAPLEDRVLDEWDRLEEAAQAAVRTMLMEEEPATIDYHVGRFMSAVKLAVSELRLDLRREGERSISRERLVGACRLLGVNPPRMGGVVPDKARRNAKAMLRDSHPDRTGGDKAKEELFRQVAQALRVVDDYNAQCKKSNGASEQ